MKSNLFYIMQKYILSYYIELSNMTIRNEYWHIKYNNKKWILTEILM